MFIIKKVNILKGVARDIKKGNTERRARDEE